MTMQYRRLGKSGLRVSVLGLGTNSFGSRADEATSIRVIHEALDIGINFIDTANKYSGTESERIIGEALKGRRDQVILATKCGLVVGDGPNERGSSRQHILREIDASLQRLQTDYIDLYQIHTFDPYTPLEETLSTLDDLVHAGKVRYIGASNYAAWELMKAVAVSERLHLSRYISVQPCYSLADRTAERELIPLCLDQGIGVIPYYPLAGGILTGKYAANRVPSDSRAAKNPDFRHRLSDERLKLGEQVSQLAQEIATTPAALSLAWLMDRPAVSTIIAGATRPEQVRENVRSLEVGMTDFLREELDLMSLRFRDAEPFAQFRLPLEEPL